MRDVSLCHVVNEDAAFTSAVADALRARHLSVQHDIPAIEDGIELSAQITHGLGQARYALVIVGSGFMLATSSCSQRSLRVRACLELMRHRYRALCVLHELQEDAPWLSLVPRGMVWSTELGADGVASKLSALMQRDQQTRTRLRSTLDRWTAAHRPKPVAATATSTTPNIEPDTPAPEESRAAPSKSGKQRKVSASAKTASSPAARHEERTRKVAKASAKSAKLPAEAAVPVRAKRSAKRK